MKDRIAGPKTKGTFFEDKAVEFLNFKGYRVRKRNFRSRFGEIDIIARDFKYIVFVEVKARAQNFTVSGLEAVDKKKRDSIRKTALVYAAGKEFLSRFDVLEIIQGQNWRRYILIKDAFGLVEEDF
ncbi:MAG: YraN family protein [Candidatus Omnitrophica bacterium]|nr:YraN family protein [Candidatus Omnitrophota bacterium]